MSMPVLTYGCTRCDLKAWDAMTWGYRFYQVKKEQYRMAVSMGWCHVCSSLVPVERRPQAGMERSLQAEQASLQAHVRLLRQQQPGARWWLFRRPASRELLQAELKLESVSNDLLRLRRLLSLMKDRQSGDRCLACGSEACFHLPAPSFQASFDEIHEHPQRLDCLHPGCGGQLTVSCDGTRLNVAGRARAYDLRGMPLGDWQAF